MAINKIIPRLISGSQIAAAVKAVYAKVKANFLNLSGGTMANTNLVGNLNADLLDGFHAAEIGRYRTIIDASSLDPDTWYPVTISVSPSRRTRIRIEGQNIAPTAPWALKNNKKFCAIVDWETNGNDYGWANVDRVIHEVTFTSNAIDGQPICGIGQLQKASQEYIFVRGGAAYSFYVDRNITPVLHTERFYCFTDYVEPTTVQPEVIERNNMLTSDTATLSKAALALKEQTPRKSTTNINFNNDAGLHKFLAVSYTVDKPGGIDAHIIHCEWDNSEAWGAQIAMPATSKAGERMYYRYQRGNTWTDWYALAMVKDLENMPRRFLATVHDHDIYDTASWTDYIYVDTIEDLRAGDVLSIEFVNCTEADGYSIEAVMINDRAFILVHPSLGRVFFVSFNPGEPSLENGVSVYEITARMLSLA